MSAGELDLVIEQGATFERVITVQDGGITRSLSGYSARMQIRATYDSTTTLVSLTSDDGGGIVIDTNQNTLTVTISAAETALLSFIAARYDFELIDGDGKVERILYGVVTLSREVTR